MTGWTEGDRCRVVEHDETTREPKESGRVMHATVELADGVYVRVRTDSGLVPTFFQGTGWMTFADAQFRWRLLPVDEAATAASREGESGDA